MPERDTFITHQSKELLLVDFSNLKADQFIQAIGESRRFILGCGRKDLLVLYDVANSRVSPEVTDVLKEAAKETHSFIKKRAVVGIHGVQRIILHAINAFSQEDIKPFDSLDQAKDWLVS
jgi:hypothetical protein